MERRQSSSWHRSNARIDIITGIDRPITSGKQATMTLEDPSESPEWQALADQAVTLTPVHLRMSSDRGR
ncbi:MAG: hypothetical protein MUQ27_14375 [Acidimicrobiia bacterium]|nr:hypothetical protein [Acidimicrobiia bacterium]